MCVCIFTITLVGRSEPSKHNYMVGFSPHPFSNARAVSKSVIYHSLRKVLLAEVMKGDSDQPVSCYCKPHTTFSHLKYCISFNLLFTHVLQITLQCTVTIIFIPTIHITLNNPEFKKTQCIYMFNLIHTMNMSINQMIVVMETGFLFEMRTQL